LYYSSLFINILGDLKTNDFNDIVDIWQKKSKDISFFEKALFLKPMFFKRVADSFILLEKYIKERWVFLSNYEIYYLSMKRNIFNNLKSVTAEIIKLKEDMLKELTENIKGYYILAGNKNFNEKGYKIFISNIYLSIINNYFEINIRKKTKKINTKLLAHIEAFLNKDTLSNSINKLENILKNSNYFSFYTKEYIYINNLINFKNGKYVKVINDIEEIFENNITLDSILYDKYIFMFLDSCIENNLYIKADEFIVKYKSKCTNQLKLFQFKLKIKDIINQKLDLNDQDKIMFKNLKNSYHLDFNWEKIARKIYLLKKGVIHINILKQNKLKGIIKGLIQIIINNKIKKEIFLKNINQKIIYKMPDNEFSHWDNWNIIIKFIGEKKKI